MVVQERMMKGVDAKVVSRLANGSVGKNEKGMDAKVVSRQDNDSLGGVAGWVRGILHRSVGALISDSLLKRWGIRSCPIFCRLIVVRTSRIRRASAMWRRLVSLM